MPKPRDLNPSGLGRAIINRKTKDARTRQESGLYSTDVDSTTKLKSITQEKDLDAFLNTAELAGVDFTAERRNVKVIQQPAGSSQNPHLLTEQEKKKTLQRHSDNRQRLRVPRRPPWTKSMTPVELDRQEKAAFLDWRRDLAKLTDEEQFLLTPFERNLEVWRQLWRVLERSQLIVQIVDARNPLQFRCEDLDLYIHDVEGPEGERGTGKGKRRSLLLINKADLLTTAQRSKWADYLDSQEIKYAFFSAAIAVALQQLDSDYEGESQESGSDDDTDSEHSPDIPIDLLNLGESSAQQDPRTKVLSVLELEDLFLRTAPDLKEFADAEGKCPTKVTVGLVGYPNVGKSSTINALLGEKKVSVSATPGKTKHFQTIHLSDSIVLCDCPGLVFPQFATNKADLICDGVLPIDQMREYSGPVTLVVQRIPKAVLEATYGLTIKTIGVEEGGDGQVTAENFLIAHAIGRGFMRSGQGNPDEARSARYILKDYINAKLLFCHPPPGIDAKEFNENAHDLALQRVQGKKKAPATRVTKDADTFVNPTSPGAGGQGLKSQGLDSEFFSNRGKEVANHAFVNGKQFNRAKSYPHQHMVGNDGTLMNPKQARIAALVANQDGVFAKDKHHKKPKRAKQRSGKGYD